MPRLGPQRTTTEGGVACRSGKVHLIGRGRRSQDSGKPHVGRPPPRSSPGPGRRWPSARRLPIGLCPGHSCRAMLSLMITTGKPLGAVVRPEHPSLPQRDAQCLEVLRRDAVDVAVRSHPAAAGWARPRRRNSAVAERDLRQIHGKRAARHPRQRPHPLLQPLVKRQPGSRARGNGRPAGRCAHTAARRTPSRDRNNPAGATRAGTTRPRPATPERAPSPSPRPPRAAGRGPGWSCPTTLAQSPG